MHQGGRTATPPSEAVAQLIGCQGSDAGPGASVGGVAVRLPDTLPIVSLAEDFQRVLEALPPDWTDLEIDLRIGDEGQYVDSAVALSQVNALPYSGAEWHWRVLVAHSFGHAAAAETVAGVLEKLDGDGVVGEMRVAEVREGRAEVVQMWGRPESVREEFRQRRAI